MPSNKYFCIVRSESGSCEPPSPAQMEAMYAKFNTWKDTFKDNIVDMGGKLAAGGKVVTADSVSDGPFVEIKEIVGGYMIIAADSMEQAVEVVQASPGVSGVGANVEIREISNA